MTRYNGGMKWVYLSPHFDDISLSCGGLVWEQTHANDSVSIWTVCAAQPPVQEISPFAQELQARWGVGENAISHRRTEDLNSCRLLGAAYRHFTIPDCIYRRHPITGEHIYTTEGSLNGPVHLGDATLITSLREEMRGALPSDAILVCPLGLGNHVDHQITRLAAEGLYRPLWYYADYPYVLRWEEQLKELTQKGWESQVYPISAPALAAWRDSVAAHGSQISTFWATVDEMQQAITRYLRSSQGITLWRKPEG